MYIVYIVIVPFCVSTYSVVLQQKRDDPSELLSPSNIDHTALERFAEDAATYATKGQLGKIQFVKNHRNKHDVSIFDFTSLSKAEHAAKIVEQNKKRILLCIAGDSLNEVWSFSL